MLSSHPEQNQKNYENDAVTHNKFGLNASLYLAYRDIPELLKKHLFEKTEKKKYRVLDFGCGTGFSTELITNMIKNAAYEVEIYGIDLSEQNIKLAKERLAQAIFLKIDSPDSLKLKQLGEFDLIICNFVLVENTQNKMTAILKDIQALLNDSGIAIVTNCSSKTYKPSNKWYSFNSDFPENQPSELKNNKIKFKEDQPVKVQVFTSHGSHVSFTFFDFFHSGAAYRKAYQSAGLDLLETHKPVGKESDGVQWKSEKIYSPYKIHVLAKQKQPVSEAKLYPPLAKL